MITNVDPNFRNYYLNQGASDFASIQFKNGTTVKSYGCAVCSIAMIICWKLGLTATADKVKVVKKVIADATNSSGDLLKNPSVTYGGLTVYGSNITDMHAQILAKKPAICRLNGHYVLVTGYDDSKTGFNAYLIQDPGSSANTNLSQPMAKYGTTIVEKLKVE